jgi:hypothetical protein
MFTWGLVLSNLALAIGKFLLKKKIQKSVYNIITDYSGKFKCFGEINFSKTHDFVYNAFIVPSCGDIRT